MSALSIPGVTAASLTLTLIQPPQVAYGAVGSYTSAAQCPAPSGKTSTCATTAQLSTDLKLTVPILGIPTVLDIPLSAATGTATLSQVNCVNNVMSNVKINVSTNLVTTTGSGVTLAGINIGSLSISAVSNRAGTYTIVPPTSASETAAPPTNPQNFGTTTPSLHYSQVGIVSGVVTTLLNSTLTSVLGPVLQAAGVSLGGAQVADTSARCDVVSIVG